MQRSPPSLSHLAAPTPPSSSFSPHHPSQQRSPLPLPQQRPQPPTTAGGGATSVRNQSALNVIDPISEARRSLALLNGTTTQTDSQTKGGGLLDTLESQVESVLNAYERAYQDDQSNLNSTFLFHLCNFFSQSKVKSF